VREKCGSNDDNGDDIRKVEKGKKKDDNPTDPMETKEMFSLLVPQYSYAA